MQARSKSKLGFPSSTDNRIVYCDSENVVQIYLPASQPIDKRHSIDEEDAIPEVSLK